MERNIESGRRGNRDTPDVMSFAKEMLSPSLSDLERSKKIGALSDNQKEKLEKQLLNNLDIESGAINDVLVQQKLSLLLNMKTKNEKYVVELQKNHLASMAQRATEIPNELDDRALLKNVQQNMDRMYKILHLQRTEEGVKVCADIFYALEDLLEKKLGNRMVDIIKEDISLLEKMDEFSSFNKKQGTVMKEFLEPVLVVNDDVAKGFAMKDGEFGFNNTNAKDYTTFWNVKFAAGAQYISIIDSNNPQIFLSLNPKEFIKAIEDNALASLVEKAELHFDLQKKGEDVLNNFDLPKNKKIIYVRILPKTSDKTLSKSLTEGVFFRSALKHNHKDNLITLPTQFTDDPDATIRSLVDTHSNIKRPVHFLIDIVAHGSQEGFLFKEKYTGQNMIDTAKQEKRNSTFTYRSIACHGAGVSKHMKKEEVLNDPDVSKRLTVFLQNKIYVPNIGSATDEKSGNQLNASPGSLYMILGLFENKGYGRSFREADLRVKEMIGTDPESFVDGNYIANHETKRPSIEGESSIA